MAKPRLCFTVVSEALRGQQFSFDLGQPIMIGRTPDNTLALDHKSVSRRHARIEADASGIVLTDLGSHNGTRVGDRLVSRHVLQSGDVVGLGEILLKFTLVDDSGAAPVAPDMLPVLAPASGGPGGAVGRPLSLEEVFAQAGPTQPVAPPKPPRNFWPVIYALAMAAAIAGGVAGLWAVGQRPAKPPKLDVEVRAGEAKPVDLSRLPGPDNRGWVRGMSRIEDIGPPTDIRVARAEKTKFRGIALVRASALGTTDIPVYGAPVGWVILRVLVRDSKPQSDVDRWRTMPPSERRAKAHELLKRAEALGVSLGENTWRAIKLLEQAATLLENVQLETATASRASQRARELRAALNARFEVLSREIDVLREQGRLQEALAKALELKKLFGDPESEEHYVVETFYEGLAEEAARQELALQEKR